ncbi:hypothetical protein OJ253_224 [Cryptosporidium canis]|uniref:Uncharacterized protein n=1 Tax=Cryptosporidium canis TaxID=195482 RepID=A0A9D5HZ53_9CRYT|nr:hypothetical protein OJ253_224 [Cryptosporidium canis]
MDYLNEFLKLNELALEREDNLTGVLGGFLAVDTRDKNFHSLNNRFSGGFLLLSQSLHENGHDMNPEQQQRVVGSIRTRISNQDGPDSIKLCVCRDLNSVMGRSCFLGLLKHYSQFLGIDSKVEKCEDISQEVATFKMNYEYLILESNLVPLSFRAVRDLLYILLLRQVRLHSRIVFYVEDEQYGIEVGQRSRSLISYLVLDPKTDRDGGFETYSICNPTGFLTRLDLKDASIGKVAINEIIPSGSGNENCSVVSRFDIYTDPNTSFSDDHKENACLNDEAILHNKLNRSKCINMFPGTCFSLFVRWSLGLNDILYPSIPKLNPASIEEGMIFLKIDVTRINDPNLVSIIQGIKFLESLVSPSLKDSDFSMLNNYPHKSGIDFEQSELKVIALRFIRKLSKIWGYSIMDSFYLNKGEKEVDTSLQDELEIHGSSNGRIDADYTDLLWGFIVGIGEESLAFKIVFHLLGELEKSCTQQLYENRFIPQIRKDNTTIFSKLVRIAIDIYKEGQCLGHNYENSSDHERENFREKHSQWESIKKNYFDDMSIFRFALMEIGFECLIADMKMLIRRSEPLLDESSFDWHLNDLYLESKRFLEESDTSSLLQKNKELILRLKKLIPVCYISSILKTFNCSWDISKKLIRSTIKYYSNQDIQESHPTIFVAPIFNKTMIGQLISASSPNQIEISHSYSGGGDGKGAIILNRVDSIELPSLNSELKESIVKFNKLPVCIWRTLSDPDESVQMQNHYIIQIEKSLA